MVINRRIRLLPALLATVVVLGACDRAAEILPGVEQEPPVREADFQLGEVRAVDPQARPDSGDKASVEAPKIAALMNSYYSAAFLDPAKWQGGQHPELAALFTAEARPGLAANLGKLALADLSQQIERVVPQKQSVDKVTFFVEDDGSLPIGVATVSFEGIAEPSGEGPDVPIAHGAHYWLQREGEGYLISAFEAVLIAAQEPAQ